MSELHKFLFEGLPVRGMLVRLTDSWQEVLRRHREAGAYPKAVSELLGEMSAAAVLMQGIIKFNGALVNLMLPCISTAAADISPSSSVTAGG